jgi:chromate reductase
LSIGQLPLFNQDQEGDPPPTVRAFKEQVAGMDAVLFVTPRIQPVGSRRAEECDRRGLTPYGKSVLSGKPGAVTRRAERPERFWRQSPSAAVDGLPQRTQLAQPEAYIGNAAALFDEAGTC